MQDNETLLPADEGRLEPGVGRLVEERTHLTPEQRARLISSGPNAGRVRRAGCYECAWGKVLGCWRCGGKQ